MKKLFYISNALPNSITSGSDFIAINMLKMLKKRYKIYAISIASSYCTAQEKINIYRELKKEKIKYYEINKKNLLKTDAIKLTNFLKRNYSNNRDILVAKNFINQIDIKKKDLIFAFGNSSIEVAGDINCFKIALFEDLQNQVQFYRTFFSIKKYNFLKKIIKLIILKIHYSDYLNWLKKISENFQLRYTFSNYDFRYLKNKLELKVLPIPIKKNKRFKKKIKNKKFNITMLSTNISQDYRGVELLYNKLLPKLKINKLLNKVKLNLVMRVPKKIPINIKKILSNKEINLHKYNEKVIKDTDMLFYPSRYPVGIRTKILFAFTQSWYVATSSDVKKCIPELEDLKNSLLSNDIDKLSEKIINLIKNENKYKYLKKNSLKILDKYSFKNFFNIFIKNINVKQHNHD